MHPKLHPAASDTKALQLRGSWSDIVYENRVIEIKSRNIKIHKANLFATCSCPSDLSGDSLTTLSGCKILLSWHSCWHEECIEGPGSKAEWKNKKRCNTFSFCQPSLQANLATLTRVAIKVLCHHTGPASAETSLGKPSRSTADGTPHVSMRGAHDSWEVTYTATLEAKDPTAIWAFTTF